MRAENKVILMLHIQLWMSLLND